MAKRRVQAGRPILRARVWVELGGGPAITDAGADLLQQIDACGSLSEAARRLGFSYRRAWLLASGMNKRWPVPLIETATGGLRGGGSHLTDLGSRVLTSYRGLQLQVEAVLDQVAESFTRSTRW
jgi:molybdate transport system regulatory protein